MLDISIAGYSFGGPGKEVVAQVGDTAHCIVLVARLGEEVDRLPILAGFYIRGEWFSPIEVAADAGASRTRFGSPGEVEAFTQNAISSFVKEQNGLGVGIITRYDYLSDLVCV